MLSFILRVTKMANIDVEKVLSQLTTQEKISLLAGEF